MTLSTFTRGSLVSCTVALSCLLAPAPLRSQQTLVLDNGDRMTGDLVRIEGNVWVFRLPFAEARVPATRVRGFTSRRPIGIRLGDGSVFAATVAPGDEGLSLALADGFVRQIAATEIEAVGDPDDLTKLTRVPIGFFTPIHRFWSASGSLGFSDKSGNSRARGISTSIEIQRRTSKDRIRLTAGLNREQSRSASGEFEPTVSKYFAGLRADMYATERIFGFVETRQDRDTFQDISLRSSYNGGVGVQVLSTATTDFRLSASAGARIERFFSNGSETAAVLKTGAETRRKLGTAIADWQLSVVSNVEDFGDYQLRSEASLTATVYKGIGFRLGVLNELDSRPRPGVEKHDMLVTTTVAYSIGG